MSSQPSPAIPSMTDMEQGASILLSFGEPGRLLKRKIALAAFLSRFLCFLIFNPFFLIRARFFPHVWERRRLFAVRLIRLIFPFRTKGEQVAPSSHSQIVVVNHPTLNDPICAILYLLSLYPDRDLIIPINLPWFEGISRYRSKWLKVGVNLVPVLTPETGKRLGTDSRVLEIQRALVNSYTGELMGTLARGGLAVIAQQATRQRHIFTGLTQSESGEGILPTISLILTGIRRSKLLEQVCFLPIGVTPHRLDTKSTLNIFRKYTLNVGKPILAADLAAVKNAAKRSADLYMLQQLMELLPPEYHFANPAMDSGKN